MKFTTMRNLAIVTALLSITSVSRASNEIYGGTAVEPGKYDSVVGLGIVEADFTSYIFCSAVVIAPRLVLTAAHCAEGLIETSFGVMEPLYPNGETPMFFIFASNDFPNEVIAGNDISNIQEIKNIYVHPDYDSSSNSRDIALVELTEPIPGITPSKVFEGELLDMDNGNGGRANIVGYGYQGEAEDSGVKFATQTAYSIIPSGKGNNETSHDMVMIGEEEHGACHGDSGGPAFVKGKIIGITSYGLGWGACSSEVYYTPFTEINSFISSNSHLKKLYNE